MKTAAIILAAVVGLSLLVAAVYFGPDLRRHFGTRYADADRDVHQSSLSYVRGTAKNLQRLKMAWSRTESEHHREMIAETALSEAATVDESKLPPHLQSWVRSLRAGTARWEMTQ